MIIYIDENMPLQLADGLQILQEPLNQKLNINIAVRSIASTYGRGAKDEDWIPLAGQANACVITQDINIQRTRHQKALFEENCLGMFFLRPPSKSGFSYWQMVQLLVKNWETITKIAGKEARPFAYRCSSKGDMEKMN